jgi:ABC-type transport system substrate-binding protein
MYFLPEPATRVQAVTGGSVDIAFGISPDSVELITRGGHKVVSSAAPSNLILVFNQAQGKYTTDQRVRMAYNLAIDKSYAQTLLNGYGKVISQPAASNVNGYQADIPTYPHDPVRAKRLLTEAGYGNGLKSIVEVVLTSSEIQNVFLKIQQDVAKVGIEMDLRPIQLADLSARGAGIKPYEGEMHIHNYGSNPAMDMMRPINAFHSCSNPRKWKCFPEIEPTITIANTEFDPVKRSAALRKIAQYYHEQAPDIFAYEQFQLDAIASKVKNFKNENWRVNWADIEIGN